MLRAYLNLKRRLGRATGIWIVGAAVTAAAGGLVLPYASSPDKSASQSEAPSQSSGSTTIHDSARIDGVSSGEPRVDRDRATSASPNPSPSVTVDEPSGFGSPSPEPPIKKLLDPSSPSQTTPAEPEVVSAEEPEVVSAEAPEIIAEFNESDMGEASESIASSSQSLSKPVDRSRIELFYATDRRAIQPWSFRFWYPVVIPLCLAILGLLLSIIALAKYQQRLLWGLGVIACLALCGMTGSKTALRYQQAEKVTAIGGVVFSGNRNDAESNQAMNYGRALVTLPPNHEKGQVERPNAMLFQYSESPDKHVMMRQMDPLNETEFLYAIDDSVQQARLPSILVFIHGYNVTFDDALLRTAQLASDLEFDGVPLLYSWPSTGRLSGYLTDEENVEWSVTHLEQLLANLKHRTGTERIHVIVHSMGNRVLLGAVERLALRYPSEQPMLDQVVLAAPDVDVGQFDSRYREAIDEAANQVTLYTSAGDRALLASMAVHKLPRLGLTTPDMRTFLGVDTVDVSEIDTSLLGHSYYGSKETLIKDIRALIELGEPPVQRRWLQEVTGKAEPVLWRFAEGKDASTVTK